VGKYYWVVVITGLQSGQP